jgi:hypothetical protein
MLELEEKCEGSELTEASRQLSLKRHAVKAWERQRRRQLAAALQKWRVVDVMVLSAAREQVQCMRGCAELLAAHWKNGRQRRAHCALNQWMKVCVFDRMRGVAAKWEKEVYLMDNGTTDTQNTQMNEEKIAMQTSETRARSVPTRYQKLSMSEGESDEDSDEADENYRLAAIKRAEELCTVQLQKMEVSENRFFKRTSRRVHHLQELASTDDQKANVQSHTQKRSAKIIQNFAMPQSASRAQRINFSYADSSEGDDNDDDYSEGETSRKRAMERTMRLADEVVSNMAQGENTFHRRITRGIKNMKHEYL